MRSRIAGLSAALLVVVGAVSFLGAPAAAAQDWTQAEFALLDYGKDVNSGYSLNQTDLHPEVDILSISSTVQGQNVKFEMTFRGNPVTDNDSYLFTWKLCFGPIDWSEPMCPGIGGDANVTIEYTN